MHIAELHTSKQGEVLFTALFSSENRERGLNLLLCREALPEQPKNRFLATSRIGFCHGRQSHYGNMPDYSPHNSQAYVSRDLKKKKKKKKKHKKKKKKKKRFKKKKRN
ncbi:hypothetical protein, partial [Klebsiella pneumoniae]|uniref:hypothetical protein n=1 Tax=Klebsiella pneumoniae TaxID=573 RepID=UPI001F4A4457